MQLSLAAAAAALLASAQAHLLDNTQQLQKVSQKAVLNYTWTVTEWTSGCIENYCSYRFNISAPQHSEKVPAFSASCWGNGLGSPYRDCDVGAAVGQAVAAKLQPSNDSRAHLAVSYEFLDPTASSTYWNYTAYTIQPFGELASFEMTPSEVWGVA